MGVLIYALLRHRGLPWWGAALPTLPVLFDSYELHLEHMVTADTLFIFLGTAAVVILCWSDRPSVPAMAVAGLLIGYATVVRSVGQPLLVVVLAAMLVRRVGWRRLVAVLVAGIVPIAAYMVWFHGTVRHVRANRFLGPVPVQPGQHLRRVLEGQASRRPALLVRPEPAVACRPRREYVWADNDLARSTKVTSTPRCTSDKQIGNDIAARFTPVMNSRDPAVRRTRRRSPAGGLPASRGEGHPAYLRLEPAARPELLRNARERPDLPVRLRAADDRADSLVCQPQSPSRYPAAWTASDPSDRQAHQMHAAQKELAGQGLGHTPGRSSPGSGCSRSTSGTSTCAARCSA